MSVVLNSSYDQRLIIHFKKKPRQTEVTLQIMGKQSSPSSVVEVVNELSQGGDLHMYWGSNSQTSILA